MFGCNAENSTAFQVIFAQAAINNRKHPEAGSFATAFPQVSVEIPVQCRRAYRAAKGETSQDNEAEFRLQQKFVQFRGNRRRGHPADGTAAR